MGSLCELHILLEINCLLNYFTLLVRSILEYGSVIWDPHTINGSLQIDRVQRWFLRFACSLLRIPRMQHDYSPVANHLQLTSLVDCGHLLNLNFLKNILSGKIDSPALLSLINFKVLQRSVRNLVPFSIPLSMINYMANEPIRRIMSLANVDPSFTF